VAFDVAPQEREIPARSTVFPLELHNAFRARGEFTSAITAYMTDCLSASAALSLIDAEYPVIVPNWIGCLYPQKLERNRMLVVRQKTDRRPL